MTFRRFRNAALGFALGVVTLPLGLALWPFLCAAWWWCETDEDDFAAMNGGQHKQENTKERQQ